MRMIARLATFALVLGVTTPVGASSLDKEVIRRPIRREISKITRCYDKQLLANPKLGEGRINVDFSIATSGKVIDATATGFDTAVAECVAAVIRTLQFPKSNSGTIRVSYPFDFRR
jgi:hypothetical protein